MTIPDSTQWGTQPHPVAWIGREHTHHDLRWEEPNGWYCHTCRQNPPEPTPAFDPFDNHPHNCPRPCTCEGDSILDVKLSRITKALDRINAELQRVTDELHELTK